MPASLRYTEAQLMKVSVKTKANVKKINCQHKMGAKN